MKEILQRLLPSHWERHESSKDTIQIPTANLNEKEKAKWQLIQYIQKDKQMGLSMRSIPKKYNMSRNTIKKYLEANQPLTYSPRMKRPTNTAAFLSSLVNGIENKRSITAIFHQLQQQGFTGSYTSVRNAVKKVKSAPVETELYSRRPIISLFSRNLSQLTIKEQQQLNQTLTIYPAHR